jgi:hypothetical protein
MQAAAQAASTMKRDNFFAEAMGNSISSNYGCNFGDIGLKSAISNDLIFKPTSGENIFGNAKPNCPIL